MMGIPIMEFPDMNFDMVQFEGPSQEASSELVDGIELYN